MTFQCKLTTKLEKYSVDEAIIELKISVDKTELNQVIKSLLKDSDVYEELENKNFDFIVGGRLLRTGIGEHFELYADELDVGEILNEKLVEIEYTLSLQSPEPLDTIKQNDWIKCVDVNNRYLITGSYDHSIRIYNLEDRTNLVTLSEAHNKPVTAISFVNDPKQGTNINEKNKKKSNNRNSIDPSTNDCIHFISSGHDETSRLWSFNTNTLVCKQLVSFKGHKRSVDCLDIQQDLLATGSFDKTIKIWSSLEEQPDDQKDGGVQGGVGKGGDDESINPTNGDSNNKSNKRKKIQAKQVSSKSVDGKAFAKRDPSITLTGHQDGVRGIRWLGNGTGADSLASCSLDGLIIIWDVEAGSKTRKFISAKPMLGLDHNKDSGFLLSASCDRFVRLWDIRAPDESRASAVFSSHSGWVSSVAFCPPTANSTTTSSNNHFVSGGYDNLVKLWDLRSPKASLYDLIGHADHVFDVNCKNPKFVVSGSADSSVRIFQK